MRFGMGLRFGMGSDVLFFWLWMVSLAPPPIWVFFLFFFFYFLFFYFFGVRVDGGQWLILWG